MEESSLYAKSQIASPTAHVPDAAPKSSRGERTFNGLVYGGLAGVGAFVATVPFAYYLKHGGGQRFHKGLAEVIEKIATRVRPGQNYSKLGENVAMTTSLMQGGNALLIPVGIAEHYKVPIVEKLNGMLGDHTPPAVVDETPKQTWMSLIKARITAWIVVFTSMMTGSKLFPRSFATFETEFAERGCQLLGKATHDAAGKETKTFIYGKIGALDVFATAAAATLLYVAGHIFAKRQEERAERRAVHHTGAEARFEEATASVMADAVPAAVHPATQVEGPKMRDGAVTQAQQAVAV